MSSSSQELDHAAHFESAAHEFETGKLGMWLFLVQEIMLFGGLFVGFALYNYQYPEAFHEASTYLDRIMGAVNTVVLLISSLTMALAISFIQRDKVKQALWMLWITFFCACTFLVVKYFEYSHKFHDGLLPGKFFSNTEIKAENASMFFSLYFLMTGLHGIHVLIGMIVILWVIWRMRRGDFSSKKFAAVEFSGLYWHLVDLIWIYLFPLLYLVG